MSIYENITSFISSVKNILPKTELDLYFLFYNDELLIISKQEKVTIPAKRDLEGLNLYNLQYLGVFKGQNCFCGELHKDEILPQHMCFIKLRPLMNLIEEDMFWIAGRAIQIVNWNKDHKYCGRCGTLTENLEGERAKKCLKCGFINYPRISPAIIVAVVKEDKLLLAHNTQSPEGMYSVLAGFVEPGETFEECVVREVFEETGIKVKNIKYFGSQPWPFPNSMMIGFTAEYESGEIQVDGKEIGHADWYSSTALPLTRRSISISTKLIDWFKENY